MYFNRLIFALIFKIVLAHNSFAQQFLDPEVIVESLVEEIIEDGNEELDFSEILSRLNYYLKHPIDLNKTDGRELLELYFLSPFQVQELINYRALNGLFLSIYELQIVTGYDERTIQYLLPFVIVEENNEPIKARLKTGKHDLILRYGRNIQKQQGYLQPEKPTQSHYLGTPDRLFIRYRFRVENKIQISLNMKKDAGEQFFKGNQKHGFDFYSASFFIQDIGKLRNMVVGDYMLQIGQGLSLWNGFSFGKGSLVQNVARQGIGLSSYTSSNESQYLRGIAATLAFKKVELLPFVSYKKIDGVLSGDSLSFSSIGISGYHRTVSENKNHGSVSQFVYGINLKYNSNKLKIGAVAFQTALDKPMIPNQQLYNKYTFRGETLTNTGAYYHYTFRNTYLFGEGAYSSNNSFGFVNGLIASLSHHLSLVILHRYYQKDFYSFLNQGFAENSKATNEKGLYSGLIWSPSRKVEWVVYADYFKFPWIKYRVDGPSEGYDLFSQFTYSLRRSLSISLRYRYRNKQENGVLNKAVNELENVIRHQFRLEGKYKLNELMQFRNRFEFVNYSKGIDNEKGYMAYHDIIFKPRVKSINGNIRFAAFKTNSYNSRVYAYENDVLYGYSFPPYYNKGLRLYSNVRYRIQRNTDLWIRYATFLYAESGIGSALDYIDGKMKSDIRLQLRIQF